MGIFDRMGKVISSNFNGLVDSLQDPRKSVEQTLLDMQEQIRAARREVVSAVAAEKQLRGKLEELDAQAAKWASRAELAVKTNDDELAREALMQKKRVTGERDRAEALRGEQRAAAHEMKAELERDARRLREYVDELQELGVEPKGAMEGLVDFPSLQDDRVVYLCWRLGEPEVLYWHEIEAGFGGRQALTAGSVPGLDADDDALFGQ